MRKDKVNGYKTTIRNIANIIIRITTEVQEWLGRVSVRLILPLTAIASLIEAKVRFNISREG